MSNNVAKYSDNELFRILHLDSPSDRELEAKINFYLQTYVNDDELFTFFTNVYNHFFMMDEDDNDNNNEKNDNENENENENDRMHEGFENINVSTKVVMDENYIEPSSSNSIIPSTIIVEEKKDENKKRESLNPFLKTVKRFICVDSQFRDKSLYPHSTHFTFELSEHLSDVISLKLYSVQIHYSWYTINNDFGSNFFYLKGNVPGIDQGYHDYKILIQPGNYESQEFVTYINESFQNIVTLHPDVNFGSSAVSFNSINSKLTTTIDITSVYNESYYQLSFPVFPTFLINKVTSIPQLLGYSQNQYSPCSIFSHNAINPYLLPNRFFTLTLKNNFITLYLYQGSISTTLIDNFATLKIKNTIILTSSLLPGTYSSQEIIDNYQTVFLNNVYLDHSKSKIVYNTDVNKYQITIIVNRLKVINGKNIKSCLSFGIDNDNPLWTGTNSMFQFIYQDIYEINNILSDTPSKVTSYTLPLSPTIKLECKNQKYNIPLNNREFTINHLLSPFTSTQYINVINLSLTTSNVDPFQCYIENDTFFPTFHCNINNDILFSTNAIPNFTLHTKDSVLFTLLNFPLVITEQITYSNFFISQSGYTVTNDNDKYQLYNIGNRNSNIDPISITIPRPTSVSGEHVFGFLETFLEAINLSFTNATILNENNTNIDFSQTKIELIDYNKTTGQTKCKLFLNVKITLRQSDYRILLFDPYGYDGTTLNNVWENEKNSWYSFLHFSQPSYDLNITPIVKSSDNFYSNQLLLTNTNNYFYINAIQNETGGVYVNGMTDYNIPLFLTLPIGSLYTKEMIVNNINKLLYENTLSSGSYIDVTSTKKTIFRININKIFTAQDYRIVFFDKTFTQCKFGSSSSVENVKWDTTIGWILGYRNLTEYSLSIDNMNVSLNDISFYGEFPSQMFQVNPITNIVQLIGDTSINVNLYNYALIALDDFCLSHLNDGLITITKPDQTISLPSYASRMSGTCNIPFKKNNLTAKQLYSANAIRVKKNERQNQNINTSSSFIQDIFAFIPIKTAGLRRGQSFVDSSGSLQNQQRTYVGPVNIHKMTVRLLSDKGSILNLNGVNWCFTLAIEQLFKPGGM